MEICSLCAGTDISPLIDFGSHPIAHNYIRSPEGDEYSHPFSLRFCNRCGLFFLHDPIPPELLYKDYFTLSSWKHQPHIPRFIEIIEQKTNVKKTSRILEVGSNDGRFLYELREKGYTNLVGMEPAKDALDSAISKGIKTIPSYFDTGSANLFVGEHGKCDLFLSRQMLEHVADLNEFAACLKTILVKGGYAIIEVPNFLCSLENLDYTLWEEHVNYFTMDTLANLCYLVGLEIVHSETFLFSGETMTVVGVHTGNSGSRHAEDYMAQLRRKAAAYRDYWVVFKEGFIDYLRELNRAGRKIAIYGAGARLCSLVNFTGAGPFIECIVDDQAEKQGLFMPGSRLPILPSSALKEKSIDVCLLAVNTECEEMVIARHADYLKSENFVSVLPPSDRLPRFWNKLISEL